MICKSAAGSRARRLLVSCLAVACVLVAAAGCDQGGSTPFSPSPVRPPEVTTPQPPVVPSLPAIAYTVCAAGDLVHPGNLWISNAVAQVARDQHCDVLALLGDYVYEQADLPAYHNLFAPVWGDLLSRIRPTLGNHEDPAAYYTYFGANAGPAGLGYYSYRVGDWLFVSLNSETPRSTSQLGWLQAELAAKPSQCEVLYWHIPYITAGPYAGDAKQREIVQLAEAHGVEMVLQGHAHNYQRFAPQTADGRRSDTGIRFLIAGTGGAPTRSVRDFSITTLETYQDREYGLLKLTLSGSSYVGEFISISNTILDRFEGTCH